MYELYNVNLWVCDFFYSNSITTYEDFSVLRQNVASHNVYVKKRNCY